MTDFLKRKMMYKSPHTSPSAWKDAYRVKCFERLRERRASLIEKFRHHVNEHPKSLLMESPSPAKVVTDVMEIEWNALSPNRRFPSLRSRSDSSSWFEDPEEEVMREALLEIQKDLQNEELDSKVKLFSTTISFVQFVRFGGASMIASITTTMVVVVPYLSVSSRRRMVDRNNILVTCSSCDWMSFLI
ncbi:hypothetical protein Avbf_11694 [Armadillidium vulgare]|nr:hypothetical protein Avbf_11694 [Armadillidium vulgare]